MNFKDFLGSEKFKKIILGIAVLVIALLIFQAGEMVGYREARFSYQFGERYYHETFGRFNRMSPPVFMRNMMNDFTVTHGATGKIVKLSLPTMVIEDGDNIEKIIIVSTSTAIRKNRDNLKPTDLKLNDSVTVIGSPNNKAEIEARLIRILPAATEII